MDLGIKDRVAIVGGSSRGLGRAIALAFAQEGASVTISARTEADLRRTEIELARIGSQHHVLAIPADLSVARDIRRVVRDTSNCSWLHRWVVNCIRSADDSTTTPKLRTSSTVPASTLETRGKAF